MTTRRPTPGEVTSAAMVVGWYWTRAQLDDVARREGVPRTGNKQQLTDRLIAHFDGAPAPPPTRRPRPAEPLLPPFRPDMVVPPGQPMTRELRTYLTAQIGPKFRFDGFMREFFADPGGRTLSDAVDVWHATRGRHRPIGRQFEYNRFTSDYRRSHPDADRQEVLAAWERYKDTERP